MTVQLIPAPELVSLIGGRERFEFSSGLTVAEMIKSAGIPASLVALMAIDGHSVPEDYRPRDGQTVLLITIAGGG